MDAGFNVLMMVSSNKYVQPPEETIQRFLLDKTPQEVNSAAESLRALHSVLNAYCWEIATFDGMFQEAFAHLHAALESVSTPEDAAIQQQLDQRRYMQQVSLQNLAQGPQVIQPPAAATISAPSTRRSVGRSLVSDDDLRKAIDEFRREQRARHKKNKEKGGEHSGEEDEDEEDDEKMAAKEAAERSSQQNLLYGAAAGAGGKDSKTRLTAFANRVLSEWLEQHCLDPYPDSQEKDILCGVTGLSKKQVDNWFVNNRKRKIQPLINYLRDRKIIESAEEVSETFKEMLAVQNLPALADMPRKKGQKRDASELNSSSSSLNVSGILPAAASSSSSSSSASSSSSSAAAAAAPASSSSVPREETQEPQPQASEEQ
jgi:hypothetical protein